MSLFFFFFFFQNVLSYEQYQRMCKQLSHNNQIKFTHTHYLNDTLDFKAYPLINNTPKTTTKILKLLHIFFTINIHSNESKKIYKKFPSAGFPLIEESKGTLFEKHTVNIIAVLYPNTKKQLQHKKQKSHTQIQIKTFFLLQNRSLFLFFTVLKTMSIFVQRFKLVLAFREKSGASKTVATKQHNLFVKNKLSILHVSPSSIFKIFYVTNSLQ
eukprot:TRINITY_DN1292_c0_g1_i4.p2 TRINITY_DN1292_c0_g1~~TRINITY_DN1292_c0_g1_i4.p2  ORF type:complete len:213 (+),score=-4.84 TRINITY_DN1292_c0_g1_i4:27-665(+)